MGGAGQRRRVALTFDMEHPSRSDQREDAPSRLLDVLRRGHTRATFFIQGRWARSHPDVARRVRTDGHLIGSHSHFHAPLPYLTDEGIHADLESAAAALEEVTGVDPRPWFRCPFGAGHDDDRVLAAVAATGHRDVHWDVDPQDWQEGRTVDEVVDTVVAGVRRVGDGAIVLMHSWPDVTVATLPQVIDGLRAAGAELVRVDGL